LEVVVERLKMRRVMNAGFDQVFAWRSQIYAYDLIILT
jgi:hypothetical protein